MIKVLLVDDEQFIRQGLRHIVDWEKYGYQVVAEAENGSDAIRILEEIEIDLAFVDIRMPGMSGMEMISYVHQNMKRRIGFVILTGYAEFQYAREALQYNVLDYILKPVQEEELLGVLKKINQEYQDYHKGQREKYDFHISQILLGKFSDENIRQVRRYFVDGSSIKYVSVEFDQNQKEFIALTRGERMEQQRGLLQYLRDLLEGFSYYVVPLVEAEEGIFGAGILLTQELCAKVEAEEKDFLKNIQKRVTCHFPCPIQIYVGQEVERLEQLSQSFLSIRVARCFHGIAQEESQVRNYEDFRHRKSSMKIQENDVEALLEAVK